MNTHKAEEAPTIDAVIIPKKTLKEIISEAKQELRDEIIATRLKTSKLLNELAEIGGAEEYEEVVLAFVNDAGPEGILISKLHAVLPDSAALTKARNALVNKEKIKAEKDGVTFLLTPVAA